MNLSETVQALEARGIIVAINLGEHQYCLLDSNCPLAIQVRKIIADAGVTPEQLFEGYQTVTTPALSYELPQFNEESSIIIGEQTFSFCLEKVIGGRLKASVERKLAQLDEMSNQVQIVGRSLYSTYLREIARTKENHILPQLSFPMEEIVRFQVYITSEDKEYIFIFPVTYHPEYIVRSGIRYELSREDQQRLERSVYLKLTIVEGQKFLLPLLLDYRGGKFMHYHGALNDCWGGVILPTVWDRTLLSLHRLKENLMNSLVTINRDSLVSREPHSMPHIDSLFERSTELGREGELAPPTEVEGRTQTRTGWGRTLERRE